MLARDHGINQLLIRLLEWLWVPLCSPSDGRRCVSNGGTRPRGNQGQPPLQARSDSLELGSAHLNPDNHANDDQRGRESSVEAPIAELSSDNLLTEAAVKVIGDGLIRGRTDRTCAVPAEEGRYRRVSSVSCQV